MHITIYPNIHLPNHSSMHTYIYSSTHKYRLPAGQQYASLKPHATNISGYSGAGVSGVSVGGPGYLESGISMDDFEDTDLNPNNSKSSNAAHNSNGIVGNILMTGGEGEQKHFLIVNFIQAADFTNLDGDIPDFHGVIKVGDRLFKTDVCAGNQNHQLGS